MGNGANQQLNYNHEENINIHTNNNNNNINNIDQSDLISKLKTVIKNKMGGHFLTIAKISSMKLD